MATKQGEFNEHMTINTELTVQGSVSAGATIQEHGNLVVQGNLSGPVVVESGGIVSVQGTITGDVYLRGGLMLVAGVWSADLAEDDGRLGLAVGTVVDQRILQDDGSFLDAQDNITVNMRLDVDAYRFRAADGRFLRIDDLPRSDLS